MAITKNKQSDAAICAMAEKAFPGRTVAEIEELTLGMCNALYKVTLSDGKRTVLKISSPSSLGKLTNERWLMQTEVAAMHLIEKRIPGLAPAVLYYDDSKTDCSGDYFFMEFAEGTIMRDVCREFGENDTERRDALYRELGQTVRKITDISGDTFGIISSDERFDSLYDFVYRLTSNALHDAVRAGVDTGLDAAEVLDRLAADRKIFDEVKVPSLVHFDIWENNVMVKNGHISAILDWERALFGDPLMEERFRIYAYRPAFYEGFGLTSLTESQKRRSWWYDVELLTTMTAEGAYRGYEDDSLFRWAKELLHRAWQYLI